jgi:hypothetical protein
MRQSKIIGVVFDVNRSPLPTLSDLKILMCRWPLFVFSRIQSVFETKTQMW